MSMPGDDGITAQILVELGKVGAQLAVIGEQLKAVPDHEQRLRVLERARWPWPTVAAVAAAGAAVAGWVAVLHR